LPASASCCTFSGNRVSWRAPRVGRNLAGRWRVGVRAGGAVGFWRPGRHTGWMSGAGGTVATGAGGGFFGRRYGSAAGKVRGARTLLGLPACSGGCVSQSQTTSGPAILVEGLTKSFGEVRALRGIDLTVPQGTVLGVLGPNGAGKTTAVRILTTLLLPDAGRALVDGYDVVREAAAVRRSIGLAGQSAAIQEELTGREKLELIR